MDRVLITGCPGEGCPDRDNCLRYAVRDSAQKVVDVIRGEDGSCGFFWRVPIREGGEE